MSPEACRSTLTSHGAASMDEGAELQKALVPALCRQLKLPVVIQQGRGSAHLQPGRWTLPQTAQPGHPS